MRTFTPGQTYTFDYDGNISTVAGGYFYGVAQFSIELGKNFSVKNIPFSSYIELSGMVQFPYNSGVLFHVMGGIGIRHEIDWIKKVKIIDKFKKQS